MRPYVLAAVLLLIGCNGVDRLTGNTRRRDDAYDNTPTPLDTVRLEPFATFAGYHPDGVGGYINLYLVHWRGNTLDNVSMLETDIDKLHIPKFYS